MLVYNYQAMRGHYHYLHHYPPTLLTWSVDLDQLSGQCVNIRQDGLRSGSSWLEITKLFVSTCPALNKSVRVSAQTPELPPVIKLTTLA